MNFLGCQDSNWIDETWMLEMAIRLELGVCSVAFAMTLLFADNYQQKELFWPVADWKQFKKDRMMMTCEPSLVSIDWQSRLPNCSFDSDYEMGQTRLLQSP